MAEAEEEAAQGHGVTSGVGPTQAEHLLLETKTFHTFYRAALSIL